MSFPLAAISDRLSTLTRIAHTQCADRGGCGLDPASMRILRARGPCQPNRDGRTRSGTAESETWNSRHRADDGRPAKQPGPSGRSRSTQSFRRESLSHAYSAKRSAIRSAESWPAHPALRHPFERCRGVREIGRRTIGAAGPDQSTTKATRSLEHTRIKPTWRSR